MGTSTQDVNIDYNSYDSCIVCAPSAEIAVTMTPDGVVFGSHDDWENWAYTDNKNNFIILILL